MTVMAFNFVNPSNNAMGSPAGAAGGNSLTGPDLEDIQTEVRRKTRVG